MGLYLVPDLLSLVFLPAMCEVESPSPLVPQMLSSHNIGESRTPVHTESVTLLLSQMLVTCHLWQAFSGTSPHLIPLGCGENQIRVWASSLHWPQLCSGVQDQGHLPWEGGVGALLLP